MVPSTSADDIIDTDQHLFIGISWVDSAVDDDWAGAHHVYKEVVLVHAAVQSTTTTMWRPQFAMAVSCNLQNRLNAAQGVDRRKKEIAGVSLPDETARLRILNANKASQKEPPYI